MRHRRFRKFRFFLRHWNRSRSLGDLLWGLPAVVVLVIVVQMSVHLRWRAHRGSSFDDYLAAARSASATGAWRKADLYYRKVLQEVPDHAPAVYELAKVAVVLRQSARLDSLLERLQAMEGEPRTSLWVGELIGRRARNVDDLVMARKALEEAGERGLETRDLSVMLAARSLELGDHDAVVELLGGRADDLSAEGLLIMAKSLQVLQRPAEAAAAARRLLAVNQWVTPMARDLLHAQAYAILGDHGRAVGLLDRQRRSEEVERLLAEVYRSWLVDLIGRKEEASSQDLALLEYGLARLPLKPELLSQFVRFTQVVSQDSLDAAFGEVASPLIVHLTLGLRAVFADDASAAAFHLDVAQRLDERGRSFLQACLEHPSLVDHRGMLRQHVGEG